MANGAFVRVGQGMGMSGDWNGWWVLSFVVRCFCGGCNNGKGWVHCVESFCFVVKLSVYNWIGIAFGCVIGNRMYITSSRKF